MRRAVLTLLATLALVLGFVSVAHAYPPDPPSPSESAGQLAELTVAPPGSSDGYSRDRFPHWSPAEGSCNTREMVLVRDGSGVSTGADCYPTAGSWYSVYDQVWIEEPSDVSVDHMVPLANAWRSGASAWTEDRREDFANDLARGQLIPVTVSSNSSKGDSDPSEWKPANEGWWCYYARHWTDVKYDWDLTITAAEKGALQEMLGTC